MSNKIARAERAFVLVHVEGKSFRDAGEILGVSHETVRKDVAAVAQALAEQGNKPVEERRLVVLAMLDGLQGKAYAIYEQAVKDNKPLAAIAALNTINALVGKRIAIEGLEAPKNAKANVETNFTIRWSDDESDAGPSL